MVNPVNRPGPPAATVLRVKLTRTLPLAGLLLLAACGSGTTDSTETSAAAPATSSASTSAEASASASESASGTATAAPSGPVEMDCSSARKAIESTLTALQAKADADVVGTCMTDDAKAGITPEILEQAYAVAATTTIDQIYAEEEQTADGIKVHMAGGERTLTTVVQEGDQWKADTLWFN